MNGASQLLAREIKPVRPSPAAQRQPWQFGWVAVTRLLLVFVLPMSSALLLYLCYFPVAWGALGWVALVPFLLLVRTSMGNFFRYTTAFAIGYAFYSPVLQWMRVADDRMYITWLALAAYCAIYFPLGLFLVRFMDRKTRLPLVVSVPVVWTALEFFRSTFCTGFSWYQLGHTQHDHLAVIQIADITGAYGVTFLLAAFNALIVELLFMLVTFRELFSLAEAPGRYGRTGLLWQSTAVCTGLLATLSYGVWQLGQTTTFQAGPRIALIQGNLDQRLRNNTQQEGVAQKVLFHYESLANLAGRKDNHYDPDLIVWPETSYPAPWQIDYQGSLAVDNAKTPRRSRPRRTRTT
jgi:apolipoprotein N-acyltransferase